MEEATETAVAEALTDARLKIVELEEAGGQLAGELEMLTNANTELQGTVGRMAAMSAEAQAQAAEAREGSGADRGTIRSQVNFVG
jgi:hypothetical protein